MTDKLSGEIIPTVKAAMCSAYTACMGGSVTVEQETALGFKDEPVFIRTILSKEVEHRLRLSVEQARALAVQIEQVCQDIEATTMKENA